MKFYTKLASLVVFLLLGFGNLIAVENIIWIPCTGKGTVVAVDAVTYRVLGEYFTTPVGIRSYASPSRYAINFNNDVIFGHRNIAALSILHYKNPVTNNTSNGLGDLLPWNGDDPEDEAIVKVVLLPRLSDTRHVSVTTDKKIIVGGRFNTDFFYVLDGTTYEIIDSIVGTCAGGYGGQVQKNFLWSVSKDLGKTLRYNLTTGEQTCFNIDTSYGICGLPGGSVFNTRYLGKRVYKLTNEMTEIDTGFYIGRTCRGVSYNPHNNRLYIANTLEDYVTELDTLGNITDEINLRLALRVKLPHVILDPTGIIANGSDIIITCNQQDTAIVYNTETNTFKTLIDLGDGAYPYFYSSTTNLSFLNPEIATTDTLDFVRELCEDERTDYLTIVNNGFANLNVHDYEISGRYASAFKITTQFPIVIPPKESRNVTVWSLRPDTNGIITADLKLYSDAINSQADSSIPVLLRAEFQTMRHEVQGLTGDTIYFGKFLASAVKDTSITVKNLSSILSELTVRIRNSSIFQLTTDPIMQLAQNASGIISVRFDPVGTEDGLLYATLELENECRVQSIVLVAEISCKPAIMADDTIHACQKGDVIKFSRFVNIVPVQGTLDSAYVISSNNIRYALNEEITVQNGEFYTIYAWANGCMSQKTIWLDVPDFTYDEEENRLVIPRNPIAIGPSANFDKIFSGLEIAYLWSPDKWIVSDNKNQRIIAVDPDSNIVYRLQILVEERCSFNYRCNVEVSPCDVDEYSIGDYAMIYPNPANEVVYINLPLNLIKQKSKFIISNSFGQDVMTIEIDSNDGIYLLNTTTLSQGSYIVRLIDKEIYKIGTFIIYR